MKKIIKVAIYVAGIAFCAACFVDGSEKSEVIEQAQFDEQAHDLQAARMSRISAGDTRYIKE